MAPNMICCNKCGAVIDSYEPSFNSPQGRVCGFCAVEEEAPKPDVAKEIYRGSNELAKRNRAAAWAMADQLAARRRQ